MYSGKDCWGVVLLSSPLEGGVREGGVRGNTGSLRCRTGVVSRGELLFPAGSSSGAESKVLWDKFVRGRSRIRAQKIRGRMRRTRMRITAITIWAENVATDDFPAL